MSEQYTPMIERISEEYDESDSNMVLELAATNQEYADLKTQREAEYDTLKDTRAEVAELQKIRKCVDVALKAEQPEQTQTRTKRHEQER